MSTLKYPIVTLAWYMNMFNPTHQQIAQALKSPLEHVKQNWDIIKNDLRLFGIISDAGQIAVLATISVEARVFLPIREYGNVAYFTKMYDIKGARPAKAKELGNLAPGDGAKYCGRGFVQTTGKNNYAELNPILRKLMNDPKIDLVANPDLLLQTRPASIAMADYVSKRGTCAWAQKAMTTQEKTCKFCASGNATSQGKRPRFIDKVCAECCWKHVRKTVNGGLNHYKEFRQSVDNLSKLIT